MSGGFCPGGFCPGGFCPGGFCPGGFCPGGFVRGVLSGGVLSGGVLSGGVLSGGVLSGGFCPGGFVRGGFVQGGVLSGGVLSRGVLSPGGFGRGVCPGGFCLGGFCPRIYNFNEGFFTMKVAENSPQNARNCTILKKILGGGAFPQTPLAKARSFAARDMQLRGMYIEIPEILRLGPPPRRNPAYAPDKNTEINAFKAWASPEKN